MAEVRINEIHYRPKNESVTEEFIELWNYGEKRVSLAGWQLDRGVQFSFNNQSIPPGAGLVIAADPDWLAEQHPALNNVAGPWVGRLGNNGETIRLLDERGKQVDRVDYATEGAWARRVRGALQEGHRGWVWQALHDGGGRSMELRQPQLFGKYAQNWAASLVDGGTPGRQNSTHTDDLAPVIFDVDHSPAVPKSTDRVTITARITDEQTKAVTAQLHYRMDGEETFQPVPLKRTNQSIFKAKIPPQPDGAVIEFFVTASDTSENKHTWPKMQ